MDPGETRVRAAQYLGYRNVERYVSRARMLFDGVPLKGVRFLEVGCGRGAWALWAALEGASRVVGIEPEAEGGSTNSLARFRESITSLGLEQVVSARSDLLQTFPGEEHGFDVITLYNVINHLDEDAVQRLHEDASAFERFVAIVRKLKTLIAVDGWLVVADCARSNFWNRVGLSSPFARGIEWHKHQDPAVWIRVLERVGFRARDLRWSGMYPLLQLTGNRLVQYFTRSHFVLRMSG